MLVAESPTRPEPETGTAGVALDERLIRRMLATFEVAAVGIAHFTPDGRWLDANAALCRFLDRPRERLLGTPLEQVIHRADWAMDREQFRALRAGLLDSYVVEKRFVRGDGAVVWGQVTVSGFRDERGGLEFLVVVVEDIAQRKSDEALLRSQEARIAAALRAGRLGVHEYHPRTGRIVWDATVRALWGLPEDREPDYDFFRERLHPDDRAATDAAVEAALDPDGPRRFEAEYRVRHARTGEERWIRADGDVEFEDGMPAKLVGTVRDITEERQLREANALLVGELLHRVKNSLAVVSAIASESFRGEGEVAARREAFLGRMGALATALQALVGGGSNHGSLRRLLAEVVGACAPDPARIRLAGPDLRVADAYVQPLSLLFHELATNAMKHGALSNQVGHVSLVWSVGGDGMLRIDWSEHGGPPVVEPPQRGFGSRLIARALPRFERVRCDHEFLPTGVRCRIELPMAGAGEAGAD
jgi:PAS domain S-box-containing protein